MMRIEAAKEAVRNLPITTSYWQVAGKPPPDSIRTDYLSTMIE